MYIEDLQYLRCPMTKEPLKIAAITEKDTDGEILSGELTSVPSGNKFSISNGIARFVANTNYNQSWDYKWVKIDQGRGLNYKTCDPASPFYIKETWDSHAYGGKAYEYARGKLALEIGCGVGQNIWRLLREYQPAKVVALDLTRGVDMFRKIMLERFPEYKSKILMVQASVFQMPFADEIFDYVFSLGVLMHTGNTLEAIRQSCRVVKYGGQINLWIYASEPIPYEAAETGRRTKSVVDYISTLVIYSSVWAWLHLFRRLPHGLTIKIIRLFSSDFWYRIHKTPILKKFAKAFFMTADYPDFDLRFINNYDGYVNLWSDTWNEHEIFPVLRENDIVLQGIAEWRLGMWGTKLKGFYI